MRALGTFALASVLMSMPLASACYRPRIESCREPLGDFSGISNVTIAHADADEAIEGGGASGTVDFRADVLGRQGDTCVAVHGELRDAEGALVEVIDANIRASYSGAELVTTSFLFYRSGPDPMSVDMTLLGTTVHAVLVDRLHQDAGFFPVADAFVVRDAGHDAGAPDANVSDAGLDAGVSDAATDAALDTGL